jgi:hypothetical protein
MHTSPKSTLRLVLNAGLLQTHRERKLSGRQKSVGEIPSRRGEIIAIVTIIELGFIGIIIITIITSTFITIVTTQKL